MKELEDEFESHAVHVSHGQDTDDSVVLLDNISQYVLSEVKV